MINNVSGLTFFSEYMSQSKQKGYISVITLDCVTGEKSRL